MSVHLQISTSALELVQALQRSLAAAQSAASFAEAGIPRPIPVLVDSSQIADWLQIRLARERGVCMGFRFVPAATFFREGPEAGEAASELNASLAAWTPDQLRWRLLPLIDDFVVHLGHPAGTPLAPRARFAFARLLAQTFDRYGRFRPDWAKRWRSGQSADDRLADSRDETWQAELWRRAAALCEHAHPAECVLEQSGGFPRDDHRSPVFAVLSGATDPLTLKVLQSLGAAGHPVSVHVLLPSLGFLGDVQRRRSASHPAPSTATVSDGGIDVGPVGAHPLLASLGQQAVGTFALLGELTEDYAEWPSPQEPPALDNATLLERLQVGIRNELPPPGPPTSPEIADLRPLLAVGDLSLRIHACHSARRELEVVRDELLRAFADYPDLQPEEVLIAATDFDRYAPLAEGVLKSGARPLPVRLTAIPGREANPIAAGMLALLRLALGRGCASELIELLTLRAVQARLETDAEGVGQLANLVRNSGLTHGCDAAHRNTQDDTGTWRAAVDRLLAGLWFGSTETVVDSAGLPLHPLGRDLHGDEELELRFASWLTEFAASLGAWRNDASAAQWAERLNTAADALLYAEELDNDAVAFRRQTGELAHVTADTPLDVGTILDWLEDRLENATSLRTSLSGEILFGRLNQVHALPCRVLVIVGLQDGAFPRPARRAAWDLLAQAPRRGDTDSRSQDRQLFLDALLAPTDRLVLTAANRSQHTGHDGPFSSTVEEVLRIAEHTVRHPDTDKNVADLVVVRHRIHPFTPDYFTGETLPKSFDLGAAEIVNAVNSTHHSAPRAFYTPRGAPRSAEPPPGSVTLEQLISFWKDPAKAWLRNLQVELPRDEVDDTDLDAPPLSLDALQKYGILERSLTRRLAEAPDAAVTSLVGRLSADRTLPPGALGSLVWQAHHEQTAALATALRPALAKTAPHMLEVAVPVVARVAEPGPTHSVRLSGEILLFREEPSILCHRPNEFSQPKHQLAPFILSAAASLALQKPVGAHAFGLDPRKHRQLPGLDPSAAATVLETLIAGFVAGKERPLGYAPSTSAVLVKTLAETGNEEAALRKAESRWSDEGFGDTPAGEGFESAAALAWRDAHPFEPPHAEDWLRWARAVAFPLQQWWDA